MIRRLSSGWMLALFATVSWGGMFPVAKHALLSLDPVHLTLVRYGVVAAVLVVVLRIREGTPALRADRATTAKLWLLGTTGITGFNVFMLYGLVHTTPERAATMMALLPFVTAVVRWMREGRRPQTAELLTFLAALVGTACLVSHGDVENLLSGRVGAGEGLVFLGVVCWAVYTVGAGIMKEVSALRYATFTTFFGALSLWGVSAALTTAHTIPPLHAMAVRAALWEVLYMATFAGVLAIVAWAAAVKALGASNAALFINCIPVTAFVIALVRGHPFRASEIIGAGIVGLALVAHNVMQRRQAPQGLGVLSVGGVIPLCRGSETHARR